MENCLSHEVKRSVKTHIDGYAYEITKVMDAFPRWAYTVYKMEPFEELLVCGEYSPNPEHAERNARQLIAFYVELDRRKLAG